MRDGGKSDKEAGGGLTVNYKNAWSVKGSQMKSCCIKQPWFLKSVGEQSKNKTSYKRPGRVVPMLTDLCLAISYTFILV